METNFKIKTIWKKAPYICVKCLLKLLRSIKDQSASLEAFLACRLIPLNKNPGLRPIGIGEVLRRIAGKVVATHFRTKIVISVGSLQVCAGQEAGCESIIHAMHEYIKMKLVKQFF